MKHTISIRKGAPNMYFFNFLLCILAMCYILQIYFQMPFFFKNELQSKVKAAVVADSNINTGGLGCSLWQ